MALRWIFFALLAVNLLLLLQGWLREPAAVQAPPADAPAAVHNATSDVVLEDGRAARQPASSQAAEDPAGGALPAAPVDAGRATEDDPGAQALGGCWLIGPYLTQDTLSDMLQIVHGEGLEAEVTQQVLEAPADFLVYSGPEPSKAAALRLQGRFAALAVDTHVIGAGPYRHAVSFGVFSAEDRARALQQRLDRDGVSARIAPLPRTRSGYFLTVDRGDAPPGATDALKARLTALQSSLGSVGEAPPATVQPCEP